MTKTTRQKLRALAGDDTPYRDSFASFGGFLAAVVGASMPGSPGADNRLERKAEASGANESGPSEGGFLVPQDFAASIWDRVYDTGAIISRCTPQPVSSDRLKLPAIDESSRADGSRSGGVRSFWVNEADTATATKPKFRDMTLAPKKLLSLAYATSELLEDAPALASWLERVFVADAQFMIESAIVSGDGAGKPLGILNSGALIQVAAESGQSAATVLPANLVAMAARLWGPSHRSGVWLLGNDTFSQLADASFSNGSPVFTYEGGRRFILGIEVALSEYSAAVGSLGDILLADFGQYLLGERDREFASSIHVRFIYDEGLFRLRYRVDGQSAWRTPVTPSNGGASVSPYIALQAR